MSTAFSTPQLAEKCEECILNCALRCDVSSSGWSTCNVLTAYRISASENFANFLDAWAFVQFFVCECSITSAALTCDSQSMLCKSSSKWFHVSVCETGDEWCAKQRVNWLLLNVLFRVEVVKQRDLFLWNGRQCCSSEMSIRTLAWILWTILSACSWKISCGLCIITPLQISGATYL